jgi:hypothetical protein
MTCITCTITKNQPPLPGEFSGFSSVDVSQIFRVNEVTMQNTQIEELTASANPFKYCCGNTEEVTPVDKYCGMSSLLICYNFIIENSFFKLLIFTPFCFPDYPSCSTVGCTDPSQQYLFGPLCDICMTSLSPLPSSLTNI